MNKVEEIKKVYDNWVSEIFDGNITKKLVAMTEAEILDGFSGDLEFGTAGMRGVMGYGSNRMNEITVTRLASAIARYVKENFENPSIVIGFDTRNNSKKFSRVFARMLTSQGIKTYLYRKFCPTPVLSYSITNFKTSMGIMITASHNNKIYNGVKVSDQNAIQISGEVQKTLTKYYNEANGIRDYNKIYNIKLTRKKHLVVVGNKLRKQFLEYGNNQKQDRKLKVVYTPLNGTGYKSVKTLLENNGFKIYVPKSQQKASGEFLTCPYPNPEFEEAFAEAKKLAQKIDADIIVATDPDADRIGVMSKTKDGYYLLSGNEVGYVFLNQQCKKTTSPNAFAVSSVVTSPLATTIAKKYNVIMHRTLTGFKNLGKVMFEQVQNLGKDAYTLCYEESCGYILRNDLYDKDGIFAALEICRLADELKKQGKTLADHLDDLYEEFGYFANVNASAVFEGNDAKQKMQTSVQDLRANKPTTLLGRQITSVVDYLNDDTGLEKQNFIKFEAENLVAIVRPSGTEPKLKFYIFAKATNMQAAQKDAADLYREIKEIVCK